MDIPADMMEEILLRLPVKTLLRFKSVCSRWFSLIGSRSFADRHYLRQGKNNQECQLLADPDKNVNEYFRIYPEYSPDQKPRSHILGPAKGVFCEVREDGTLILSNPAMREVKTVLPPLPLLSTPVRVDVDVRIRIRALAFGFGLDPLSGAFKIVAFTKTTSKELHHAPAGAACVVYNSTTNSWKHLGVGDLTNAMPRARWCHTHKKSRYLNGVYYWLLRSIDWKDAAILAFDMVTEEFRELIPGPDRDRLSIWHLSLAVYQDSLALMRLYQLGACRCVDLWVMVGRVWKYRFSLGPFQDDDMAWLLCLRSNTNNNRHDLFLETLDFSDQILSDLSTRMVSIHRELPPSDAMPHEYLVIPYKESLLSIKGHYTDDIHINGQNPNPSSFIN